MGAVVRLGSERVGQGELRSEGEARTMVVGVAFGVERLGRSMDK